MLAVYRSKREKFTLLEFYEWESFEDTKEIGDHLDELPYLRDRAIPHLKIPVPLGLREVFVVDRIWH